jgi:uncharacterized Zn finger protein
MENDNDFKNAGLDQDQAIFEENMRKQSMKLQRAQMEFWVKAQKMLAEKSSNAMEGILDAIIKRLAVEPFNDVDASIVGMLADAYKAIKQT